MTESVHGPSGRQSMDHVGRLAPTPSGRLHLGNVCAFAGAWLSARAQGGRLLLRIEAAMEKDAGRQKQLLTEAGALQEKAAGLKKKQVSGA